MNKTEKMKLVIWDLDNTIWDGILLEDDLVFDEIPVEISQFHCFYLSVVFGCG